MPDALKLAALILYCYVLMQGNLFVTVSVTALFLLGVLMTQAVS